MEGLLVDWMKLLEADSAHGYAATFARTTGDKGAVLHMGAYRPYTLLLLSRPKRTEMIVIKFRRSLDPRLGGFFSVYLPS